MKILFKPTYLQSDAMRLEYFRSDILENTARQGKYKVLDVGCSKLDLKTVSSSVSIFGVDRVPSDVYDDAHFKLCDLNNGEIPYGDETFDFIVAGEILEHVRRPFEFIEELSRILKKNGILYLSTPNPYYYLEVLKELIGNNKPDDEEHLNLFSRIHLLSFCKKCNLELVEHKKYKFWVPYMNLMILTLRTPRLFNYQNIFKFRKIS